MLTNYLAALNPPTAMMLIHSPCHSILLHLDICLTSLIICRRHPSKFLHFLMIAYTAPSATALPRKCGIIMTVVRPRKNGDFRATGYCSRNAYCGHYSLSPRIAKGHSFHSRQFGEQFCHLAGKVGLRS